MLIYKGYTFFKKDTDMEDILYYVNGMKDALELILTENLHNRKKQKYTKQLKDVRALKKDLIGLKENYYSQEEISKIRSFSLHSKEAYKIVGKKYRELKRKENMIEKRVKSTHLEFTPTLVGARTGENEDNLEEINFCSKSNIITEEDLDYYEFDYEVGNDTYANANGILFNEMLDAYTEKEEESRYKVRGELDDKIEKEKKSKIIEAIRDKNYYFNEQFDFESAVKENPDIIYVLKELGEINDGKYCLGLEIPGVVYENATKSEKKMIEKYKKAISKKKETLERMEKKAMELIEPRKNKEDIERAIEYISVDSKIDYDIKEKLLKILETQLKEEKKKENRIEEQIARLKAKGNIEGYTRSEYEEYSEVAKMQEEYELSNKHKDKIIYFWKQTIKKEVLPKKKKETLLLTDGEKGGSRNQFIAGLNFKSQHTENITTNEQQKNGKDAIKERD